MTDNRPLTNVLAWLAAGLIVVLNVYILGQTFTEGDAMFHHLLVPLDGSRMSESSLPTAVRLARRAGAVLTLVHVVERHAPAAVHDERHLVTAGEASAYLSEVLRMPVLAGLRVETHVHEAEVRDVARSITEHAAEIAPDLVVMSIHGTGGARRLLFGTIAQQVIGHGATPVLLVRPSREAAGGQEKEWTTFIAPIDGNPAHEKILPLASELAAAFACRLHLLMVIPNPGELTGLEKAASVLLAERHARHSGDGQRGGTRIRRGPCRGAGRPPVCRRPARPREGTRPALSCARRGSLPPIWW